ncbi:MAG: hypothetical protein B7Y36_13030 [Novosphingobium sp. 28-62-57]|nr:MAG: hypothetical protein B7Z34_14405 [Novosphingobium sp. 12-62-10]OYZ09452.1 MAG: hypothetical protein B7Y36_13030 [Novosphingobium sp. 28-62-57]OZA31560.1 MAG: hypothetical protein B7X92_14110 [Novosphingobium sp. 17-62-9]
MSSARNFDINFFLIAIFFNIVPLVIIFDVWRYRIGWDEEFIFARPISNFSSYMKMRFDDIEVVDVRARNSLLKRSPADYGSDVIVLYRKEWDGHEIFALDPSITHPYHFKELIKNIYSRRPKAFTDDALDYMQKIGITVTLY